MRPGNGQQASPAGVEGVAIAAGAVILLGLGVIYGGAWLAGRPAGGEVSGDVGSWISAARGLASHPDDPSLAWGGSASGLPGPAGYWAATGIVATVSIAAVVGMFWLWRRTLGPPRTRFGVDTDARQARARDVKTLVVSSTQPGTGRMLLGRMAPRGPLVATEDRDRHARSGRAGRRQGSRGSVALIGPTQAGKTVLLSAGMIGWEGPVVALSVKRDLYDVTSAARADRGAVAVFDPGGSTGLATARWTPLRGVATASGALRAGRALAAAIPRNGVSGGDYWAQQGESFVSAYMALAGLSQRLQTESGEPRESLTIQRLAAWAFLGVGITEPTVNDLVRSGLQSPDLETRLLAKAAALKLTALHNEDPRIRASIYATARLAFEAWSEPSVAHSASLDPRDSYFADEIWERSPRFVDLAWLMGEPTDGRTNTLYLVAPDAEFDRLAPVLGGLLGDLREQIHAGDVEGRRLAKPLLFVIDEAAQLELKWLPHEVSTIAGLGGMFVTCWQSKAQIDSHYGSLSDAVLGGHRSKVVFTGCDDPATLDWLGKVAGTEHVARRSWSADAGGGRRTISESSQREDLVGPHVVRQMWPGEAVLLHGSLPPVHLRSVQWWKDPTLRKLVPTDADGRPVPVTAGTCPLRGAEAQAGDAGLEASAIAESAAHLPPPDEEGHAARRPPWLRGAARSERATPDRGRADTRRPRSPAPRTERGTPGGQLSLLPDEPANRHAGACRRCHRWVDVGAGTVVAHGRQELLVCASCGSAAAGPEASR